MRTLFPVLIVLIGFVSCHSPVDECPAIWKLDKHELVSYASIDSARLVLSTWHPISTDAIELNQVGLNGDFDLQISLNGFVWDSLVYPQFRFEVFNAENPNTDVCGVAVNPLVSYCYVGAGPENRDIRLVSELTGALRIVRANDVVTCSSMLGDVSFQFSDTVNNEEMGVRLVLGSTQGSVGKAEVRIESFELSATNQTSRVLRDDFDCESW